MNNTLVLESVRARLWNERNDYDVQLGLKVRVLLGANGPEGYAVIQAALVGGVGVEDGMYTVEYLFHGRQQKESVRVVDGMLLNPIAA